MNYPNHPPQQIQASPNIVLAIVSLAAGAIGLLGMLPTLLFTLCGIIPIGFGIAALVMGILAKLRAKNDPTHYGGGGLAIGGICLGIFCIIAPVVYVILWVVLMFGIAATNH